MSVEVLCPCLNCVDILLFLSDLIPAFGVLESKMFVSHLHPGVFLNMCGTFCLSNHFFYETVPDLPVRWLISN